MAKAQANPPFGPVTALEVMAKRVLVTNQDLSVPDPTIACANPAFGRITSWPRADQSPILTLHGPWVLSSWHAKAQRS